MATNEKGLGSNWNDVLASCKLNKFENGLQNLQLSNSGH